MLRANISTLYAICIRQNGVSTNCVELGRTGLYEEYRNSCRVAALVGNHQSFTRQMRPCDGSKGGA